MELRDFKHIHFIGIGGIGVSAIAEIVKSRGVEASGSDMKASEVTENLEKQGIKVYIGHSAEHIEGADLVVYSTAVSLQNPEIVAAQEKGIPVMTRSQALGLMMTEYPVSVAISGTHGKTTTTSMVSLILEHAGLDPTVLVGGILNEFHSNARIGRSDKLVTEACEYMDSFLDLKPLVEIILNIDSDHLDYFKDIDHIAKSFGVFADNLREGGFIVAYDSNPFVKAVTEKIDKKVVTFGFNETSDYYAKNITFNEEGHPSYDLYSRNGYERRIELGVPGEHNVANSLAAIAACEELGYETEILTDTLDCEAKDAGKWLAGIAREHSSTDHKLAFIAGGETIVHITGTGLGGRNQELALAAAEGISGMKAAVFSVGSDGTDGPTNAAGGYVDGESAGEFFAAGIDVAQVLKDNDSYHALEAMGGLIITGPTGTNVNDFACVLVEPL